MPPAAATTPRLLSVVRCPQIPTSTPPVMATAPPCAHPHSIAKDPAPRSVVAIWSCFIPRDLASGDPVLLDWSGQRWWRAGTLISPISSPVPTG
uniref:Uncharacterized protein n=1 Tax=Arundo donax TaxID=35708 RepID=A0A0A9BP04_ARUDO